MDVVKCNECTTIGGNNLGGSAEVCGDDGFTGIEGFNEGDAEGFGVCVGLEIDVCGGEEFADVRLPTEEVNAVGDAEGLGELLDLGEVSFFGFALGAADEPTDPGKVFEAGEGFDVGEVAFVFLPAGYLDDDGGVGRGAELGARGRDFFGAVGLGGRRDAAVDDIGGGGMSVKFWEEFEGEFAVGNDEVGAAARGEAFGPVEFGALRGIVEPEDLGQICVDVAKETLRPSEVANDSVIGVGAEEVFEGGPCAEGGPGSAHANRAEDVDGGALRAELRGDFAIEAKGEIVLEIRSVGALGG